MNDEIQIHTQHPMEEPTVARVDGRKHYGGHGVPPTADQLMASPEFARPDLSHRSIKQRLVGNIWFVCGFCCLGGILFGADIASMSAVLALNSYNNYFGQPSSSLQGGISSCISAGSFAGSLVYMWAGDRFGRRGTIMIACLVWFVGCIIQAASQNVPMLIVGRIIAGVCVGLVSSVVPVYQSELAPPEKRGRMVALQQWGIDWGILLGYVVQYGCSFIGDGESVLNFRVPWSLQLIPAIILLAGCWFILPESPRWLASHGRHLEALETLANVHRAGDVTDPFVLAQWAEIREAIILENELELSIASIIKPKYLKRLFLGCSVQLWCQLSGINAMMYYIVFSFQSAGLTGKNVNLIASLIQYICFVCGTFPAILYMDTWGRRPTWIAGGILQGISLFLVGGLQGGFGSAATVANNQTTTWVVENNLPVTIVIIIFSYMFIICNGMLYGPVSWCYPTEIYPLAIRSHGIGISTAATWAGTFAVTYFAPVALNTIQWKTYFIFGVFCFVGAFHFWLMFPETRRRSLEEMDALFESKVPAWRTRDLPTQIEKDIQEIAAARREDWARQVANLDDEKKVRENDEFIENVAAPPPSSTGFRKDSMA